MQLDANDPFETLKVVLGPQRRRLPLRWGNIDSRGIGRLSRLINDWTEPQPSFSHNARRTPLITWNPRHSFRARTRDPVTFQVYEIAIILQILEPVPDHCVPPPSSRNAVFRTTPVTPLPLPSSTSRVPLAPNITPTRLDPPKIEKLGSPLPVARGEHGFRRYQRTVLVDACSSILDAIALPAFTPRLANKGCLQILLLPVTLQTVQSKLSVGKVKSYIKCVNVDYESSRIEAFDGTMEFLHKDSSGSQTCSDIQLNAKGMKDLYESFKDYIAAEMLDGENKYRKALACKTRRKQKSSNPFPLLYIFNRSGPNMAFDEMPWSTSTIAMNSHLKLTPMNSSILRRIVLHLGSTRTMAAINGIPPICQRNQGRTIMRFTNAYMLVHIREFAIDEALAASTEPHLTNPLTMEVIRNSTSARQYDLRLYLDLIPDPTKLDPPPQSIIVFLKHFDTSKQTPLGAGKVYVLRSNKLGDLIPPIDERMRCTPYVIPPTTAILYEKLDASVVEIESGDYLDTCHNNEEALHAFLLLKTSTVGELRDTAVKHVALTPGEADETDKVIGVFHFSKELTRTYGVPFLFVVKRGKKFSDTKKRSQARLAVPDKEFAKYRFALVQLTPKHSSLKFLHGIRPAFLADLIHDNVVYVYHSFGVHALDISPVPENLSQALRTDDEDAKAIQTTLSQGSRTNVQQILPAISVPIPSLVLQSPMMSIWRIASSSAAGGAEPTSHQLLGDGTDARKAEAGGFVVSRLRLKISEDGRDSGRSDEEVREQKGFEGPKRMKAEIFNQAQYNEGATHSRVKLLWVGGLHLRFRRTATTTAEKQHEGFGKNLWVSLGLPAPLAPPPTPALKPSNPPTFLSPLHCGGKTSSADSNPNRLPPFGRLVPPIRISIIEVRRDACVYETLCTSTNEGEE
ncbi:hypothetical protein NMY22_g9483 [Coprinellus aureogranulatus]|nr:hypothetical protein NMY22_g9483 [Coprinellus aureogranulatus]